MTQNQRRRAYFCYAGRLNNIEPTLYPEIFLNLNSVNNKALLGIRISARVFFFEMQSKRSHVLILHHV